jgi:hypothetical protein
VWEWSVDNSFHMFWRFTLRLSQNSRHGDLNFPIPIVWFTYILKILWSYSCIFVCSCAFMCAISQSNGTQSRWPFCGWCPGSRSNAVSAVSSAVVLSLLPGLEGFGVLLKLEGLEWERVDNWRNLLVQREGLAQCSR